MGQKFDPIQRKLLFIYPNRFFPKLLLSGQYLTHNHARLPLRNEYLIPEDKAKQHKPVTLASPKARHDP